MVDTTPPTSPQDEVQASTTELASLAATDEIEPQDLKEPAYKSAVLVALTVYRVEGINAAESKFYAECLAHLWWHEPGGSDNEQLGNAVKEIEIEKDGWGKLECVPKLYFENARGEHTTVDEPLIKYDPKHQTCHMGGAM